MYQPYRALQLFGWIDNWSNMKKLAELQSNSRVAGFACAMFMLGAIITGYGLVKTADITGATSIATIVVLVLFGVACMTAYYFLLQWRSARSAVRNHQKAKLD